MKVVLAEDARELLSVLQSILEGEGYSVLPCGDGKAALEELQATHADLVIADCIMPRLSGPPLANSMREQENLSDIPVILISCADLPREARKANVRAFLRKPFSLDDFLAQVRQQIDR